MPPCLAHVRCHFVIEIAHSYRRRPSHEFHFCMRNARLRAYSLYLYACESSIRTVVVMSLILSDKRDILEWSAEELCLIPKNVLLRHFGDYVELLWDKLSDHLRADSEVQSYRRCLEHYNQPWQKTHIDGPTPLVKNCIVCQSTRDE